MPNLAAIMQSGNLYAYCMNNPVRYADPSGHIIEFSSNATAVCMWYYADAVEYLQTSSTAAALIQLLMNSSLVFTISFNNSFTNNYDPNTRTINWDPTGALVLGNGIHVQSAALILAHEMGHAAQHLEGVFDVKESYGRDERRAIEELNLARYETPIARELGEFTRRNYYDTSKMYRVSNPTVWGVLHTDRPMWHYINPLNWGKPSQRFENLNPWNGVKMRAGWPY